MAYPPKYDRQHSFSDWQEEHPSSPLPADWVEDELNTAKLSVDGTIDNLKLIQRSDGALGNRTVGFDQLKPEIRTGVRQPYPWAASTAYALNDAVSYENSMYVCAVAHTSTSSFYDDLIAGKWTLVLNLEAATLSAATLFLTRAEIPSRVIPYQSIILAGYSTKGDLGAGALYVRGTSTGPMAIRDAAGTWWNLALPGYAERAWFGASGSTNTAASIAAMEAAIGGVLHFAPGADDDPANALTGTWPQYPTTLLEYEGDIPFSAFVDEQSAAAADRAKRALFAQNDGDHSGSKRALRYTSFRPKGSGINGPGSADYAEVISLIKHDWLNPAAEKGEIDAQYIIIRQGGPDADANDDKSDAAATLADLANIGPSGFIAYYEVAVANLDRTTFLPTRQIVVQCAPINTVTSGQQSYGHVYVSKVGTQDVGCYFSTEGTSRWGDIIRSAVASVGSWLQFKISDLGKLTWRQANDDAKTVTLEGDTDGALHTKKLDGTTLFKVAQTGELTLRSTEASATYRTIKAGSGTPDGAVTGNSGDLFLRTNPTNSTAAYIKFGSDGTTSDWRSVETRAFGTTANRPTGLNSGTDCGFKYFDQTLVKPIFWSGSGWIDAAGTSV